MSLVWIDLSSTAVTDRCYSRGKSFVNLSAARNRADKLSLPADSELFIFPSILQHWRSGIAVAKPSVMENAGGTRASILLVDDDAEVRKALMKILEREGYQVVPQATANDAVHFLGDSNRKFDLVITDVSMPGMRGTTFLTVLKTAYPDLPVIVITAFGDWGQYDEVLRGGACEYLSKPFDKEELLITVRNALAHSTTR